MLGNNTAGRHPAATTLLFGTVGFLCGFLLSLAVSAYRIYACIGAL
jgi:hypothetical protein